MDETGETSWSLLPSELLVSIAERLHVHEIARLRAVCTYWACSLGNTLPRLPPPSSPLPLPDSVGLVDTSSPWMIVPNTDEEDADYISFRYLSDSESAPPRRLSRVPEMVGRRFIGGSPDGWLVTLDLQLNPRILNPLTRQEFPLPSLFTLPSILTAVHYDGSISGFWYTKSCKRRNYIALEDLRDGYIKKIVLTSAPPSGVAVVLFGLGGYYHRMSLARPRDAAWTPGPEPPENTPDGHRHNLVRIADVVYDDVGQLLYAACDGNIILAIDIKTQSWKSGHPPPVVSRISYEHFVPYASIHEDNQRSLVFIGGEMLMVWRTLDFVHESRLRSADGRWEVLGPLEYHVDDHQALVETSDVRVAKYVALDRPCHDPQRPYVTEHGRWVPVDLEDVAIFLGCNHSISLPVADKRGDGMQPNSVYFTEESTRAPARRRKPYMRDAGVYDLKKKTFEKRYFPSNCKVNWPPPIWFMPSGLCKRTPA